MASRRVIAAGAGIAVVARSLLDPVHRSRRWSSPGRGQGRVAVRPQRPRPGPTTWRLTRSVDGHSPHRKLRRKVWVDDALTTGSPRTPTVPPARPVQSASSMQSPPASAEALTSVSILLPSIRPSRRAAEVKVMVDEFTAGPGAGKGGRQEQAGIGHQAMIVKEDADTVGFVLWQHLLGAGTRTSLRCFCSNNHYPGFRGAPSGFFKGCPQGRPSVDSGLRPCYHAVKPAVPLVECLPGRWCGRRGRSQGSTPESAHLRGRRW